MAFEILLVTVVGLGLAWWLAVDEILHRGPAEPARQPIGVADRPPALDRTGHRRAA